jgi:hypothetical protein
VFDLLSSSHVLTLGLTSRENQAVRDHLESLDVSLVVAKDYRDLTGSDYFLSILNIRELDEDSIRKLTGFYTEVDGGLTEKVILAPGEDALSLASHARVYPDFAALEAVLGAILEKAHARAKREENTIHNILSVLVVLREIRNHPGMTTARLAEKTGRNPAAVRRYLEALRVAGERIEYDGKTGSWKLQHGESVLLNDADHELIHGPGSAES